MQFKYQKVELSKINLADASFRITESDVSAELVKSIAAFGVFTPPALLINGERYGVVSGFARIKACLELGISEIFARIIEPDTPEKKCVQLAVAEKSFQKDLNPVELARAIQMLNDVCNGPEELLDMAQSLGLAVNRKMVNKLIIVTNMPDNLKKGLATGAIALPMALLLNDIKDKNVLDEICEVFIDLNLSLNRQRALFEWIVAISKREKVGIEQILAEKPLQKLRQDQELDPKQKKIKIRQYLQKRRWPTLSSFENQYSAIVKKLQLKKGARLIAPANFEDSTYSIQIDFKNLKEMKEMKKEVERLVRSPHMAHILEQFKT